MDPDTKVIEVAKSVAQVKINDLVSLLDVPYLTMQNTGHKNHDGTEEGGVYATSEFKNNLEMALDKYYQSCLDAGIPENQIVLVTSEAASLVWGGLYDISHNWQPSHCGHRKGDAIDIGMGMFSRSTSPFKDQMLEYLEAALRDNDMYFPVPNERPINTNSSHWHAQQQ